MTEEEHDFYNWLAGFIDGEGYFGIIKNRTSWRIEFVIKIRMDDKDIIHEIHNRLGIGKVYKVLKVKKGSPQIKFVITSTKEARVLVNILTEHPLRAKKKKDFEIWKKAVYELSKRHPSHAYLNTLFLSIKKIKEYECEYIPQGELVNPNPQFSLFHLAVDSGFN
jgi:hypothetical protein